MAPLASNYANIIYPGRFQTHAICLVMCLSKIIISKTKKKVHCMLVSTAADWLC